MVEFVGRKRKSFLVSIESLLGGVVVIFVKLPRQK